MTINLEPHIFRSPAFAGVLSEAYTFFTTTPIQPLPEERFLGTGVYALYYIGNYEPYAKIAALNHGACVQPIYVGKAVPAGWRTGRTTTSATSALYRRLVEHRMSIHQVTNLEINDFLYRFVILSSIESDLIVPLEARLIRYYLPLWNVIVDGFGHHDPGSGRYNQARSEWMLYTPAGYRQRT